MLRITEIKLPLDHTQDELSEVILQRLGVTSSDLLGFSIARRGYDARKRGSVFFVYTLDVELKNPSDEVSILHRLQGGAAAQG